MQVACRKPFGKHDENIKEHLVVPKLKKNIKKDETKLRNNDKSESSANITTILSDLCDVISTAIPDDSNKARAIHLLCSLKAALVIDDDNMVTISIKNEPKDHQPTICNFFEPQSSSPSSSTAVASKTSTILIIPDTTDNKILDFSMNSEDITLPLDDATLIIEEDANTPVNDDPTIGVSILSDDDEVSFKPRNTTKFHIENKLHIESLPTNLETGLNIGISSDDDITTTNSEQLLTNNLVEVVNDLRPENYSIITGGDIPQQIIKKTGYRKLLTENTLLWSPTPKIVLQQQPLAISNTVKRENSTSGKKEKKRKKCSDDIIISTKLIKSTEMTGAEVSLRLVPLALGDSNHTLSHPSVETQDSLNSDAIFVMHEGSSSMSNSDSLRSINTDSISLELPTKRKSLRASVLNDDLPGSGEVTDTAKLRSTDTKKKKRRTSMEIPISTSPILISNTSPIKLHASNDQSIYPTVENNFECILENNSTKQDTSSTFKDVEMVFDVEVFEEMPKKRNRRQSVSGKLFKAASHSKVPLCPLNNSSTFLTLEVETEHNNELMNNDNLRINRLNSIRDRNKKSMQPSYVMPSSLKPSSDDTLQSNSIQPSKIPIIKLKSTKMFYQPLVMADESLTNCMSALTYSQSYISIACNLLESSDSFLSWSLSMDFQAVDIKMFCKEFDFANKLCGHLMFLCISALALVSESNPVLRINGGLKPIANAIIDIVRGLYNTEKLDSYTKESIIIESIQTEKKKVTFSSSLCGACVSPPNERIVNSWKPIEACASRLHTLRTIIYSVVSKLEADRTSSFLMNAAIVELFDNQHIAERSLTTVLQFFDSSVSRLSSLIEAIRLIVPDLSYAMLNASNKINASDLPDTILKERISWNIASVIRAKLRWLYDDYYPTISSGARYNYKDCRSGLYGYLIVTMPSVPILDRYSTTGKTNVSTVTETNEKPTGHVDVSTVPLSTLFTQALRQYAAVTADMQAAAVMHWSKLEILEKTELAEFLVAAEGARGFLLNILTLSDIDKYSGAELFKSIEILAQMLVNHESDDDAHLTLCHDLSAFITKLHINIPMLMEACDHITSLEVSGLQHPLAMSSSAASNTKIKSRRRSSIFDNINEDVYNEVKDIISNCTLVFDFPYVQIENCQ